MSFINYTAEFDDFVEEHIDHFEAMDPNNSLSSRPDRQVYPEFSEPINFAGFTPLASSSNFNIKQGMKFISNKEKQSNQRFQPYNRAASSNKNILTTQNSFNKSKQLENISANKSNDQDKRFSLVKNRNNVRPSFIIDNARSDESSLLRQKNNMPGCRQRHLIGSVDQVLRWHKSVKKSDLYVTYEANGILECKRSQEKKNLLFIRGESGHILQAIFYEVDRAMPACNMNSQIIVTGRMIGFRKMHVFDITTMKPDDYQPIQRLSFLSQRALNEALDI